MLLHFKFGKKQQTRLGASLAFLVVATSTIGAVPTPPPKEEQVVIMEDFNDNQNKWSNITTVNDHGSPSIKSVAITKSTWTPSESGPNSTEVASIHSFKGPINPSTGKISIVFRAKIQSTKSVDAGRFGVAINETSGNQFIRFNVRPGTTGSIQYRNDAGDLLTRKIDSSRTFLKDTNVYYTYKVTISPAKAKEGPVSAEAFYFDAAVGEYVSLGSLQSEIPLKTGLFGSLTIFSRNGENGAATFDSILMRQASDHE